MDTATFPKTIKRSTLPQGVRWDQVAVMVSTPLRARDRQYLDECIQRISQRDGARWRDAWSAAWRGVNPQAQEALRVAYETIWIPHLEGRAGAGAVWGAAIAIVLSEHLDIESRELLAAPWNAWCAAQRNIFGDGGI